MNPNTHTPWREVLRIAGLTLVVMLAMPGIAVLLFFARAALLAVLIAAGALAVVGFAFSRRFRGWLRYVGEPMVPYKGLELATDVALAPVPPSGGGSCEGNAPCARPRAPATSPMAKRRRPDHSGGGWNPLGSGIDKQFVRRKRSRRL